MDCYPNDLDMLSLGDTYVHWHYVIDYILRRIPKYSRYYDIWYNEYVTTTNYYLYRLRYIKSMLIIRSPIDVHSTLYNVQCIHCTCLYHSHGIHIFNIDLVVLMMISTDQVNHIMYIVHYNMYIALFRMYNV